MSESFRIGVRHTAYHLALRQWRESQGFNKHQAAESLGISNTHYGRIEALKTTPSRELIERIERATFLSPDEICPPWLRERLRDTTLEIDTELELEPLQLGDPANRALELPDIAATIVQEDLRGEMEARIATLKSRYQRFAYLRYGFDGGGNRTLEEVGNLMGVSRARAYQIEQDVLRRLRHPRLSRPLRVFLNDDDWVVPAKSKAS